MTSSLKLDTPSASDKSVRVDVALSCEPETAFFNAGGGKSEHMLVNLGEKRLVVKIRCSNNSLYRVVPVAMFIESGQCQAVNINRLPGPSRTDKLIIQYKACEAEDDDPKKCYANKDGPAPAQLKIDLKINTGDKPKKMSYERIE